MITKEQAFGMYRHIAKVYYINTRHPDDDCKLILRTFEDMTDEEMSRFNSYYKMEVDTKNHYKLTPKSIGYLISIGIDVFNLKERGWAIYETDLKKGTNNE